MAASTVQGLLDQLPQAVEAQLGRDDRVLSRDAKHSFAKFGATRLKRDGTVQVGRQDRKALEQLVSGIGDRQDPKWLASASKALDNVMRAHVERLPAAIAGDDGKARDRAMKSEAVLTGVGTAGVGSILGATPIGHYIAEGIRVGINGIAQSGQLIGGAQTFENVWNTPATPGQAMGIMAAAGAISGVGAYLEERKSEQITDARAAAPAAWTQAHGAAVRSQLGISLPNAPLSAADAARVQMVKATAQHYAQVQGRADPRAVLSQFVVVSARGRPPMVPAHESARPAERAGRGTGDGPALSGLKPAGSQRESGESAVARPATTDSARKPEGRTGPNG